MNRREFFKTSILPASVLLPASAFALEPSRRTIRVETYLNGETFRGDLFLILEKNSIVTNCRFLGNVKIFYKDRARVKHCDFKDGLQIIHNDNFYFCDNLVENQKGDYIVKCLHFDSSKHIFDHNFVTWGDV